MRNMKDSGVEWIGEIPAHWDLVRLKSLIEARDGGAWGEEAAGRDGDMICLRIADFDYQRYCFKSHGELTVRHYKPDVIDRLRLVPGDILVEKSGGGEKTPVGRAVIFDKDYPALYANFMDRLRCKDGINPQWILYNWANLYANNYTRPYIKQTTGIQNLDISALLSSQFIALPSADEQEKILGAVLSESKKVDTLIENVQAQIEKLKVYKQSLITEVVTKGLDPNVPMKDSGVDWIGTIPDHWCISKIRHMTTFHNGDRSSKYPKPDELQSEGIPFITSHNLNNDSLDLSECKFITKEKYNSLGGAKINKGDIIFCLRGSIGKCAINLTENEGTVASSLVVIRPVTCVPQFLLYFLFSSSAMQQTDVCMNGTCAANLSAENVGNYLIAIPNQDEQKLIVSYLDNKCSQINHLISIKQSKIEKLEQYKKSLIYEYVTGKKEV